MHLELFSQLYSPYLSSLLFASLDFSVSKLIFVFSCFRVLATKTLRWVTRSKPKQRLIQKTTTSMETDMITTPNKRQKIDSTHGSAEPGYTTPMKQVSSPLVHTPKATPSATTNDDMNVEEITSDNDIVSEKEEPTERAADLEDVNAETNDTAHVLSPIKIASDKASVSGDSESNDALTQFINRHAQIVQSKLDGIPRHAEDFKESSHLLLDLENQLGNMKNTYEKRILSLNDTIEHQVNKINELNNQIGEYNQKIANMHLTIEQANHTNKESDRQMDQFRSEIKLLESSIEALEHKLHKEAALREAAINQVDSLDTLVKQILKYYENQTDIVKSLREDNSALRTNLNLREEEVMRFEETLKNEQEILAQELYIQYAEKHESKIAKLRQAYESKLSKNQTVLKEKIALLQQENETLKQDLSTTKKKLQVESSEKQHLVKLWDDYMTLDKKDVNKMATFVNRLK